MKIGKYISELLYRHESVLLPGVGTFTKKYEPAKFIPEEKIVKSPAKIADFSPEPKQGETPLTAYIAEQEGISRQEVTDYYSRLARETEHTLEAGNKVELESLGQLYKDTGGSLQFEPDRTINYLADDTGVAQVKAPVPIPLKDKKTGIASAKADAQKPKNRETKQTKKQEVMSEPRKNDKKKQSELSPALKWVALILIPLLIILIILFFNYNFFFGQDGFFRKSEPVIIEEPVIQPEPAVVEEPLETEETEDVISPEPEDVIAFDPYAEPPKPSYDRPVYIIVVGSFRNEQNAQNLALQLRKDGAQLAGVLEQTHAGYYRTYYGYHYNLNDAKKQKSELPEKMQEVAWILHR
jgi:hypothetical protein